MGGALNHKSSKPHANAALVGKKMLAGLDRGRRVAIEQAQARSKERASLILAFAVADIATGKSSWGRSGRIARKLRGLLSESQVRRILRTLSSVRELSEYTPGRIITFTGGISDEKQ